ncbi:hypothetical protein [Micromonospora echinofusca]|uniref:hypothetical protein n=1 Tax=Micromonospora echinofusca TaxID=47858 RepID=UPI003400769E
MNPASRRASKNGTLGNIVLDAGLLVSAITLSTDTGATEPHILAGFLVATGIGLHVEAAIIESRS